MIPALAIAASHSHQRVTIAECCDVTSQSPLDVGINALLHVTSLASPFLLPRMDGQDGVSMQTGMPPAAAAALLPANNIQA